MQWHRVIAQQGKKMNLREQYIEALNHSLDGCYRDFDYYESMGMQRFMDEVEAAIDSLKQQIKDAEQAS